MNYNDVRLRSGFSGKNDEQFARLNRGEFWLVW